MAAPETIGLLPASHVTLRPSLSCLPPNSPLGAPNALRMAKPM
jgi:hypothetical protein